jgi:predicted O-linked N-acetylglucosamine transferase (SPINDLY family)
MILVTAIAERILVIRKTSLFAEVCAAAAQPQQVHIVVTTTSFTGDNSADIAAVHPAGVDR